MDVIIPNERLLQEKTIQVKKEATSGGLFFTHYLLLFYRSFLRLFISGFVAAQLAEEFSHAKEYQV